MRARLLAQCRCDARIIQRLRGWGADGGGAVGEIYTLTVCLPHLIFRNIPAHRRAPSRGDPEGGAGGGVPRLRLVTAGSGGSGPRPPGTMTWLRGTRCTHSPEAMPETEARPPAQNRHGGAPRGVRTSQGARHASQAWWSRLASATGWRLLGAPLPVWGEGKDRDAAPARAISGRAKRWLGLFDIVRWECARVVGDRPARDAGAARALAHGTRACPGSALWCASPAGPTCGRRGLNGGATIANG